MRELKFRAWFNRFNKMVYEVDKDTFDLWKGYWNGKIHIVYPDDGDVVEQYTGLKDKNGKEIYEGDIVQIDSMDELRVGYVELVADQYCIVCGEEDGYKIVAEFYYYSKPEENCKVIGNIHENPGLLEGKE